MNHNNNNNSTNDNDNNDNMLWGHTARPHPQ